VIGDRFGPTILLIGPGELIAIFVGLGLGAYTGWRRGGWPTGSATASA